MAKTGPEFRERPSDDELLLVFEAEGPSTEGSDDFLPRSQSTKHEWNSGDLSPSSSMHSRSAPCLLPDFDSPLASGGHTPEPATAHMRKSVEGASTPCAHHC